jgi:hypothetical protein
MAKADLGKDDVVKRDLIYQLRISTGKLYSEDTSDELVDKALQNLFTDSDYLRDGFYSIDDIKNAVEKTLNVFDIQ